MKSAVFVLSIIACLLPAPVLAGLAQADDTVTLDRLVVVVATRLKGVSGFDIPASVDTIKLGAESNRAYVNVSEPLAGIAGVTARDRQNHAQDTQLSIRGFGARSTFGVRGVRLFSDSIPASMPDGQGQLSHFSLAGGDRIEVIRGPFSALHGNSSGGVVQLWSADGKAGDPWRARANFGSDGGYSTSVQLLGGSDGGSMGYNLALSRFGTDGYREHSTARRDSANLKLGFAFDAQRRLDLVLNFMDLPDAQDPLGLAAAQYRADPRQATSLASQFDTRKSVRQQQGGLIYEQQFDTAQTMRLMAYAGQRQVEQYLALSIGAQSNPLNSGGVINLDNDYGGADVRWSWRGELVQRPFEFTMGANFDHQRQQRQGYENFVGSAVGVRGQRRRDESNRVNNADQYAQAWWQFAQRWALLAGLRRSEVEFRSRDRYVTASNPDDSGGVRYGNTTPVAGLMFSPTKALRLYWSIGRGFETPTFNELGYRAGGGAGLALDLLPATSRNLEAGLKWRSPNGGSLDAALFRADTDDELAVARNVGGRSSFRNVGRARRQGFEAGYELPLGIAWQLRLVHTWLDATFRDDHLVCSSIGCTTPSTRVAEGARIPGVPEQQFFARLQWRGADWSAAVEAVALGDVVVNDIATETAPGHGLLHLEAGRAWRYAQGSLRTFARVENLFDRSHIGSVIVNEGNARYYEPGAGRTWLLGAQWQW